jgi:hypothetical protein
VKVVRIEIYGLWLANVLWYQEGGMMIRFSSRKDFIPQNCCVEKGILFFQYE